MTDKTPAMNRRGCEATVLVDDDRVRDGVVAMPHRGTVSIMDAFVDHPTSHARVLFNIGGRGGG